MDSIKELIQVIERNKVKEIDVIGYQHRNKASKLNEFYVKITESELHTDEDAAEFFFHSTPDESHYRKLKSKLKTRLINSVFFLNLKQSNYTEIDRAYITCWKEWAAAKILFNRGAVRSATDLARRILKQANTFEFTELSLNICKTLRSTYASRVPDPKKFSYYNNLTKKFMAQWQAEMLAEEYYFLLAANYLQFRAAQPKLARQAEAYSRELAPYMQEHPTSRLQRYVYQIQVIAHLCRNDYRSAIAVSEAALRAFDGKSFNASIIKSFFHLQIIAGCTFLKEYEQGQRMAAINLELENPGSFNWFKNRELSFILAMHTRNYQQAYEIYLQVVQRPEFKHLDPLNAEYWKIFEAYVMYLKTIGRVETSPQEPWSGFRLGKFLNEVPIFSRDKEGMNIPILIAQILLIIANRRYEQAIDRIEAVEKYCTRYLRKDHTYRSNVFIRMLLSIPNAGFHRAAVLRNAKNLKKKLEAMPLEKAQKGTHFEVIPYEDLWAMTADSLHQKIYVAPRNKPARLPQAAAGMAAVGEPRVNAAKRR